jgi:hypothetical protein
VWEDGISLTSGRSGLASAVIYQPSCHQSYSQDCIANMSSNREYDDDRKPPDGHDDDGDISSRGAGSSFHLNCSSNFFSNSGRSGSQREHVELVDCDEVKQRITGELYHMLDKMKTKLNEHCVSHASSDENRKQLQQQLNDNQIVKLAKFHMKCNKHTSCPLQTLKRRFRHFIFSNKDRNSRDKLCKSKGN